MRISQIEVRNPYCPCTTGRLHLASWGGVTTKISLVLVRFGLIKLKPNQNTVNPNRDSPNGYPTVTPAELQPVTLAH